MKLQVDRQRCEGHGLCTQEMPEFLHLDDEGTLIVRADPVPESLADSAHSAANVCPVAALTVAP
ncbi:ferredoxin [Mycolicibacter sinensis]